MTAIQLAAVIGFVVVGIAIGAYGMTWIFRVGMTHSTIESIKWITCDEGHLHGVKIEAHTPFSGKWQRSFALSEDFDGIEEDEEVPADDEVAEVTCKHNVGLEFRDGLSYCKLCKQEVRRL